MSTLENTLELRREFAGCLNVWHLVESIISKYGSAIAQTDSESGESITYYDILNKAVNCSSYLVQVGIKKGDVVAIISKNSVDFIWQILGCLRIGATCALLSSQLKRRELDHLLGISEPTVIIAPDAGVEQTESIMRVKSARFVFTNEKGSWDNSRYFPIDNLLSIDGKSSYIDTSLAPYQVQADDTAFILSSSGSTGLPKGVVLTHQNIMATLAYSEVFMREKGPTLGLMPFCHAFGLGLMLMALCENSTTVIMPNFSIDKLLDAILKHQIVNLHVVPSIIIYLSKIPDSRNQDLGSVKFVMSGAAPINPDHQKTLKRKLNSSAKIYHSFGMTETTFVTIFGEMNEDKPSSPGRVLPGISARIVDENGVETGDGEHGELVMRCPMVMRGYLRNEQANKETFANGWLRTGDIAYVDKDGYVFIVERKKELIKYQGHQISPSELEMVLTQLEGVTDVAIIGVPHEVYGEVPRAIIVKNPNCELTEDVIIKTVRRELASFKQLRGGVEFVEELPKSPTGKVLRGKLSRMHSAS